MGVLLYLSFSLPVGKLVSAVPGDACEFHRPTDMSDERSSWTKIAKVSFMFEAFHLKSDVNVATRELKSLDRFYIRKSLPLHPGTRPGSLPAWTVPLHLCV